MKQDDPKKKPKLASDVKERIAQASVRAAEERRREQAEYDRPQLVNKRSLGHKIIADFAEVDRRMISRRAAQHAQIGEYGRSRWRMIQHNKRNEKR